MDVSILAVGTELLFGQTVNTNAAYLSRELNLMGFNVMYHFTVGDNPARLQKLLETALAETDIVIMTGGLGPTQDDLTKETVAKVLGVELYLNEGCLKEIKGHFDIRGLVMTENNIKQAYIPQGAVIFHNKAGTAPAFAIKKNGKHVICFPGPPRELTWLFENCAKDYLHRLSDKSMYYKVIRLIGIGESELETTIMTLINGQTDPTIATYAKEGEVAVRIASQDEDLEKAKAKVEKMTEELDKLVGQYVYSHEGMDLVEVVVQKLKDKGLKLTTCESCTSGMIADEVASVAGASDVFEYGYVTYSEAAKSAMVDVPPEIIEKFSVVSGEVAEAMADGALKNSNADIAISVTGYAGPEADPGRECGDAFIGYAFKSGKNLVKGSKYISTHRNTRKWNRQFFTLRALMTLNEIIDNNF